MAYLNHPGLGESPAGDDELPALVALLNPGQAGRVDLVDFLPDLVPPDQRSRVHLEDGNVVAGRRAEVEN